MSRQLKFRAWCPTDGEMLHETEDQVFMIFGGKLHFIALHHSEEYWRYGDIEQDDLGDAYKKMIPMQFTGLLDKNGKEIYEGDIVNTWLQYSNDANPIEWLKAAKVTFADCAFEITDFMERRYRVLGSAHSFEVIGNIYENPELLK